MEQRRIPADWPAGAFDLVVLSEVAYYCPDLDLLIRRMRSGLADDAVVVACHWRHAAPDHAHDGDAVHRALAAGLAGMGHPVHHEETDFLLDVWSASPRSVAQLEGIVP